MAKRSLDAVIEDQRASYANDDGDGGRQFPAADDPIDLRLARLPRNDVGNAQRLLARFGDRLLYVMNSGWFAWDDRRWSQQHGEYKAKEFAHATAAAIVGEARALRGQFFRLTYEEALEEARRIGLVEARWDGNHKDLNKLIFAEASALERWAIQSGNAARTMSMLAQAQPMRRRDIGELDARPYLLNFPNGTLELKRGGDGAVPCAWLRPHNPVDLLTKVVAAPWDQEAFDRLLAGDEGPGSDWERALVQILERPEERGFLARWFGYTVAGPPDEQAMLVMSGEGSNGKSVIVETVEAALGDYTIRLPIQSLMQDDGRRGSEARPDLVELPGRRLAVAVEPDGGARLSTGMIKELTERSVLRVRQLHAAFISFVPQHRLVIMCNERPVVRGADKGTWRRIKNLTFRSRFVRQEELKLPGNEYAYVRDDDLPKRLMTELSVVLAWLVVGWLDYASTGLQEPQSVRDDTEDYRMQNDPIGEFLKACVVPDYGGMVTGQALYGRYKDWCAASGVEPWSGTAFGRAVGARLRKRVSGVTQYLEIRLKEEGEE